MIKRAVTLFMAFLLLVSLLPTGGTADSYYHEGDTIDDFTLTLLNGQTVSLDSLLEAFDLVVLNFWATWCGPCVGEMPALQEAALENGDRVCVICVNIDTDENGIEAFRQRNGLTLNMAPDPQNFAFRFLIDDAIPVTAVIGKGRRYLRYHCGMISDKEGFISLFEECGALQGL